MPSCKRYKLVTGMVFGLASIISTFTEAPLAAADPPPLPAPPNFTTNSRSFGPSPGSFSNFLNRFGEPPAKNDARGVQFGANADIPDQGEGLPADRLGDTPHRPSFLTQTNARYRIAGGIVPPQAPSPGPKLSGGDEQAVPSGSNAGTPPNEVRTEPKQDGEILPQNPGE
jgi:hypothetical protein